SAGKQLLEFFNRNGYVRRPDLKIRKKIGCDRYKKGWEVRLTAKTDKELDLIRNLLDEVGLKKGKPFKKEKFNIQPIYGKQAVEWFINYTD
ncbi:MAG: hypothetical protein V1732_03890, partial [Patescibacteria group bacterium]